MHSTSQAAVAAGYIGSASLLKTVASLVELLRKQNADLVYSEPCSRLETPMTQIARKHNAYTLHWPSASLPQ